MIKETGHQGRVRRFFSFSLTADDCFAKRVIRLRACLISAGDLSLPGVFAAAGKLYILTHSAVS